jgi:hypothetical protein
MPDPGIARAARLRRVAGILCLVLAAMGGAYVFLRGGGTAAPLPEKTAAAPTVAPLIVGEAPTALPVVVVPTPPRVRRAAAETEAGPEAKAVASRPAAPEAKPAAATSSTNTVPAVAPPPAAPPAPRSAGPRTYAGTFTPPGGEKIELGGIAWSEEEPRALLNDRVVGVGGYVGGYSVSKIETDRVVLEKDGATVVLTVKP